MTVAGFISGGLTQKLGYYVPSMLASGAIMSIGNGLMATFQPDTGSSHWIAFQFLSGFGLGCGIQTGGLAMQTVLPKELVSTGIAVNMFAQAMGGGVFTSVGQAILSNLLVQGLEDVRGIDAAEIVKQGATDLLALVPEQDVPMVVTAYNYGLTRVFLAAMGLTLAGLVCAAGMEWKSIKKGKPAKKGQGESGGAVPTETGKA
jgi:MFS family permease